MVDKLTTNLDFISAASATQAETTLMLKEISSQLGTVSNTLEGVVNCLVTIPQVVGNKGPQCLYAQAMATQECPGHCNTRKPHEWMYPVNLQPSAHR